MAAYIDYNVIIGVNLGLMAIMLLPISAMLCASFLLVRRSKDPARVAFTYLKVMLPLAFLWFAMYTIEGALELVYQNSTVYWWTNDSIYKASLRTSLLGSLFYRLAGLLSVMTLVELGNGFLFCLTETRTALQKAMRNAGIASCIVLFIIAFASFGIQNEAYSQYLATPWAYEDVGESLFSAGGKLSAAFDIILFAWAVVLVVFAVLVFKEIKHNNALKNSAVLFLAAIVLNLIARLYGIIYASIFNLAGLDWGHESYTVVMFLDPFMSEWIFTVIVALVFSIAIRKRNGLWTTMQPWMDAQGPPALATSGAKGMGQRNAAHVGRDEEAGRGW
ncbi:hypothetical protein INS49_002942 [Diaporthe citri]|uniref:uncharacterized protein n=1 Tax=Diaporthe citri TaxID=83186 RepID=UPI001C7EEF46|nr:uncharacterized protein INS49_002942 [Diaporthe citri]KAG6368728.1 hypothetical protein INS49_002942 [Diaporthe citri]